MFIHVYLFWTSKWRAWVTKQMYHLIRLRNSYSTSDLLFDWFDCTKKKTRNSLTFFKHCLMLCGLRLRRHIIRIQVDVFFFILIDADTFFIVLASLLQELLVKMIPSLPNSIVYFWRRRYNGVLHGFLRCIKRCANKSCSSFPTPCVLFML